MKTFYAWVILTDTDQLDQSEFLSDDDGAELQFETENAALDYMDDARVGQLIAEGIDPNNVALTAYELEVH